MGDKLLNCIESETRALKTIEYEHHEIHDGCSFTVSRELTHGAGASPNILILKKIMCALLEEY